MPQPPALLMLSGGIDSAFCMWQALSHGRRLHVHHINLDTAEGRMTVEKRAAQRILEWHRARGLTNFTYTESTIRLSRALRTPYDRTWYSTMAGVVFITERGLKHLIHPRHKDGLYVRPGQSVEAKAKRADMEIRGHIELVCGRTPVIEMPILHMTKAEIIQATPRDLLQRTWYCRRPHGGGINALPCHRTHVSRARWCPACRQVAPVLAQLQRTRGRAA